MSYLSKVEMSAFLTILPEHSDVSGGHNGGGNIIHEQQRG
jgi:hypothetical protein